jgi:hypothetical protein
MLRHPPGVYSLDGLFVTTRTSNSTLVLVALVAVLGLLLRFASGSLSLLSMLRSRLARLPWWVLLPRLPLLTLLARLPLLALLTLVSIVEAFNRGRRRVSSLLPHHLLFGLCQLLALGSTLLLALTLLLLTLTLLLSLLLLTLALLWLALLIGLLFGIDVLALFLLSMMLKLLIDDRLVCRWLPGILALGTPSPATAIVGLLIRRGITVRFRTWTLVTGVVVIQMSYS